jgi:hypothetical protein
MDDDKKDVSRINRRSILLGGTTAVAATALLQAANAQTTPSASSTGPNPSSTSSGSGKKPNFVVIFGDDIGITNLSCYSFGMMGYKTPNIDRMPMKA